MPDLRHTRPVSFPRPAIYVVMKTSEPNSIPNLFRKVINWQKKKNKKTQARLEKK